MKKFYVIALASLALAGCGDTPGRGLQVPPASGGATTWMFQASPGMPREPSAIGAGFWFDFPVGPEQQGAASVHYVVRSGMSLGGQIRVTFRVDVSGAPRFQYRLHPDNTCGGEANVSLYMQRRGDDWSGQGAMGSYRWYSKQALTLKDGEQTLIVPLEVTQWINVWGQSTDATNFVGTVVDAMAVGLTFGGGCFKGHGVNINQGSARFMLTEFTSP